MYCSVWRSRHYRRSGSSGEVAVSPLSPPMARRASTARSPPYRSISPKTAPPRTPSPAATSTTISACRPATPGTAMPSASPVPVSPTASRRHFNRTTAAVPALPPAKASSISALSPAASAPIYPEVSASSIFPSASNSSARTLVVCISARKSNGGSSARIRPGFHEASPRSAEEASICG